jgi:hypothetical protein
MEVKNMAVYIAALGNDPAAMMAGFLFARAEAKTPLRVILIREQPENDLAKQRHEKLEAWLLNKNASGVTIVPSLKLDETDKAIVKATETVVEGESVWIDATGGTKVLSSCLWNTAKSLKARLFTQNAHGSGKTLVLLPTFQEADPAQMELQDFFDVYLPEGAITKAINSGQKKVLQHYSINKSDLVIEYKRKIYAVSLKGTKLELVDLYEYNTNGKREDFTLFDDHAKEIGGALTQKIVLIDINNDEARANRIKQARSLRMAVKTPMASAVQLPRPPSVPTPAKESVWSSKEPTWSSTLPSGKTLLVLASGQVLPVIQTYSNHPDISNVVILRSSEMVSAAGRMHKFFKQLGKSVFVLDDVNADDPTTIYNLTIQVLRQTTGDCVVNFNGGTASMAIEFWRAIIDSNKSCTVEYIDDISTYHLSLSGEISTAKTQPLVCSISDQMALHGVRFEKKAWKSNEKLTEIARRIMSEGESIYEEVKKPFMELMVNAGMVESGWKPGQFSDLYGHANECLTLEEIKNQQISDLESDCGGHLFDQDWIGNSTTGKDQDKPLEDGNNLLNNEVDAIIRHQGRLFLIEVKPTLEAALGSKNREHINMVSIAERSSGRFARGFVVVQRITNKATVHVTLENNLKEALDHNGTRDWLNLWVRDHNDDLPDGVYRFPDDLKDFLEKVKR